MNTAKQILANVPTVALFYTGVFAGASIFLFKVYAALQAAGLGAKVGQ